MRVALPATDPQILSSLENDRCVRYGRELRAQAIDHLARAEPALLERFQADVHKPGVGGAAAASEGNHVGHGRVRLDHVHEPRGGRQHRLKRCVLRALNAAGEGPVVLQRKKPLWHDDQQDDVDGNRDEEDSERERRMLQHPSQRVFVHGAAGR